MRSRYGRRLNLWEPRYAAGPARTKTHRDNIFFWRFLRFWKTQVWTDIKAFLNSRQQLGYDICPSPKGTVSFKHIFRALEETPFQQVKIVILGQDPYYQQGLADGLAFSVRPNVQKIPEVLRNILKEYSSDTGYKFPLTGNLTTWARNGILLWHVVPTIETQRDCNRFGHSRINGRYLWQELTVEILYELSRRRDKLVFILWGKKAQEMRYMIDEKKHLVITGPHPSPRNYTFTGKTYARFAGGKYFTKACEYLNISTAIWKLP